MSTTIRNVNLKVFKQNNQTRTKFGVKKTDTLVFHNEGDAELVVKIKDNPDALCQGGKPRNEFKVRAGDSESFTICSTFPVGKYFEYTAQIAGALLEDPIIIVE